MNDKVFKKQLEKLGIEETVYIEGDLSKKRQLEFAEANLDIVKAIMDTIEGRQYLYSKLDLYGVFTAPFVGEKPITNSYFAGVQSAGQDLLGDIMKAAPNNFILMCQEEEARKANKA